jgi:hypothetical protein
MRWRAVTVDVAVVPLVDEGLGNSAYLVDLGDGRALVVDANRDLRAVRWSIPNAPRSSPAPSTGPCCGC